MQVEQRYYINHKWSSENINTGAQLVFAFISPTFIIGLNIQDSLKKFYPQGDIIYISTYGSIIGNNVYDEAITISAIEFQKTPIKIVSGEVSQNKTTSDIVGELIKELYTDDLKYIFVISDGVGVNGEDLIKTMKNKLPRRVGVVGGMAGDDPSIIKNTYTGVNSFSINTIVMIGFYGDSIKIGNRSVSGQKKFGIKRTITKSKGNIVYEFDGKPALDLYKEYLGDKSGVFFPIPLGVFDKDENESVVKTLLKINEQDKGIMYTSDIPKGYNAYFMKAGYDELIEGAGISMRESLKLNPNPEFAFLISCASRKLILRQRIEEEIEEVISVVGKDCKIAGFYSYGEIGTNINSGSDYFLHSQTMTTILISED